MSETYIDLEPYEDQIIAQRSRTAIIFLYPFIKEAYKYGMRVQTRDGRVVKKVRVGGANGVDVVVGILDGEELRWDAAGRFLGPYQDDDRDLYIPERYMYKDWRENIGLSNSEWAMTFGKRHPGVKMPKRDNS